MFKSKKLSKFKNINHYFFSRKGGYSTGLYKGLNCGRGSEDKKINAIGFTKHGRKILENQEHIFVEGLVDCEKTIYNELSTEAKLEIWKSKHNRKGGN